MKSLFRLLGGVVATFFILVFLTLIVGLIRKVWFGSGPGSRGHIAVLDVSGVITSSNDTLEKLDEMVKDESVKALVVRINSPGGMVAPSQDLYDAFKRADAKFPVIISMQSVAASGGYYASLGGRKVFAQAGTLTASIGVIMELINAEKLFTWAKLQRDTVTAGKMKDAGSPLKPMSKEERAYFQALLNDVHAQFRAAVKERRKLSDAELDASADGRVMSGSQALKAKLIDALGGFDEAVKEARTQAKLPESAPVVLPDDEEGLAKKILFGKTESLWRGVLGIFERSSFPVGTALTPGWTIMLLAPVRG